MLEMGDPVRILDLAERMIRLSGYQVGVDIPIEVVGIRPGEKLDEVLRSPEEEVLTTYHPYINRLIPITAAADELDSGLVDLQAATSRRDAETVRRLLFSVGSPTSTGSRPRVDFAEATDVVVGRPEQNGHRPGHDVPAAHPPHAKGTPSASSEQVPA